MKLVRDDIPHQTPVPYKGQAFRRATPEELPHLRCLKLVEEVGEFLNAFGNERAKELADILQVVHDIAEAEGISFAELEAMRAEKHARLGGFTEGWVLE